MPPKKSIAKVKKVKKFSARQQESGRKAPLKPQQNRLITKTLREATKNYYISFIYGAIHRHFGTAESRS